MSQFRRGFEVIDYSVEAFVPYAAGMATSFMARLHNSEGITSHELSWLEINTTGSRNPDAMCQQLIDRHTLRVLTARLKS